jgi:hypothetical protein
LIILQRARQFLSASAKLEFWETFRFSDPGVAEAFRAADAASASGTADTLATSVVMRDSVVYDNLGKPIDTIQVAGSSKCKSDK